MSSLERSAVGLRLAALALLVFLQYEAVEIALRAYYEPATIRTSIWGAIGSYRGYGLVFGVLLIGVLVLLLGPRLPAHVSNLRNAAADYAWRRPLVFQLVAYGLAVLATWALSTQYATLGRLAPLVIVGWVTAVVTTAVLSLLILAPARWWLAFARAERAALAGGLVATVVTAIAGFRAQQVLPALGLRDLTMQLADRLLRLRYDDVVALPETHTLGTPAFQVQITDACAGYEGIALVTVFLVLYLSVFRRDFRFPRVLLMVPVGIVAIWAFNVLRIATLVVIGTEYSPGVAIAGFHSNAGWIAFILVSLGLIAVVNHSPFFAADTRVRPAARPVREADGLLGPFVVLLAATLLTSTFSAGFNWLYPVNVLATGAALWAFRGNYRRVGFEVRAVPLAIGAGVFLLWIALVPATPQESAALGTHLQAASSWAAGLWLVFRVLGSVVTIPLAEELAFRGYLLARLGGSSQALHGALPFAWLPVLLSSVLFGLLHDCWLAGTLAGFAYALARHWRGQLGDAVLAHMTTNALLSAFVLATQRWAYW